MNFTLAALSIIHYSLNTPFISPSSYQIKSTLSFDQVKMSHFFTNFIKDHSVSSRHIEQCHFSQFLKPPVSIVGDPYRQLKRKTLSFMYSDDDFLEIIGCIFQNCYHVKNEKGDSEGGAIEYKRETDNENDGKVILYSTTFENCSAAQGNGGALFICNKAYATGFDSTHTMISYFNSSYCCYSKCSAFPNSTEVNTGYGPVMFAFAKKIILYYSSSVNCPYRCTSYGAQYDLSSNSISSSFINASSSTSRYCSAMEYRKASEGYFTFQTFVDLKGGFMSSFTNLQNTETINMSYCNFVNDEIEKIDAQSSSIIYVRNCKVFLSHFCFVNINVKADNFYIVKFSDDNVFPVSLSDSVMDESMSSHLKDITTNNIRFYKENEVKYTNSIQLLDLGNCKGEFKPPPTIFSSVFTPSSVFTETAPYSKSEVFSKSNVFTKSGTFTPSKKFSPSKSFTPSIKFTQSKQFSKSSDFTESKKFSQSKTFSPSSRFTKSNSFTPSSKFTPSNRFTPSKVFSKSGEFTKSDTFNPSKTFTKSNSFTPSNRFTPSSHFTPSSGFTPSKKFTPSNVFTKSNIFTASETFRPTKHFNATDFFTPSNTFSPSNKFSSSERFTNSNQFITQSNEFNATEVLGGEMPVDIHIKEENEPGISKEMKIGIGVTAGVVVAAAVLAAFILLRKRKTTNTDFDDADVEVRDDIGSTVVTANPLVSMMNNDDPFEDSFQSNASFTQILKSPSLRNMPSNTSIRSMRSNISLNKLPSVPGLNDPLANESIHHMPSATHVGGSPSLHQVGSLYDINDNLADS